MDRQYVLKELRPQETLGFLKVKTITYISYGDFLVSSERVKHHDV